MTAETLQRKTLQTKTTDNIKREGFDMLNLAASVTILLLFFIFMYVMLHNAGGWTRCSGCGRKIRKENIRVMKSIWTDKLVWRCPKCGHYNLDVRDRKDDW